jgi:hypothetical protein
MFLSELHDQIQDNGNVRGDDDGLGGAEFFMSSHTSSGINDAVIMTEKYLAQRFCRNRPVPSISNSPAYKNDPMLSACNCRALAIEALTSNVWTSAILHPDSDSHYASLTAT